MYDKNQVTRCYDLVAEEYANRFFNELEGKPFDRNILTWFSRLIPGHEKVIETGCGPGEIARFLKDQGVNISGIDISQNMIDAAKRLNPDIDFSQGDMLNLKLENDSIFGIVAFYAIVHFTLPEVKSALQEFKRVLKPGGYVLFSFHIGSGVLPVKDFLEQKNADADFVLFQVEDIVKVIDELDLDRQEVITRYPYIDREYESKRAYILLKKK
jgi:ubiquinone/menaquinone biosynthesis C-methylase UbiE